MTIDSFVSALSDFDRALFYWINQSLSNPVFDQVMPIVTDLHRQPSFWIGLTIIVAIAFLRRRGSQKDRRALSVRLASLVAMSALSMALADLVSYRAVKVFVQRPRPEAAETGAILRTSSHSGWSFPSNHSANMFALARSVQLIGSFAPGPVALVYGFAATVAFSRVYVGVHYPSDVAGGAAIGWLCATFTSWITRRLFGRHGSRNRSGNKR